MLLYSFLSRYPTISNLPPTLDKRRLLQASGRPVSKGTLELHLSLPC